MSAAVVTGVAALIFAAESADLPTRATDVKLAILDTAEMVDGSSEDWMKDVIDARKAIDAEFLDPRFQTKCDADGNCQGLILRNTVWDDPNTTYTIVGPLTISDDVELRITNGVNVVIGGRQTITVNGKLNILPAGSITIEDSSGGIEVNGSMAATDTQFVRINDFSSVSRLYVNPGGRLLLRNSTFAWDRLEFAPEVDLKIDELTNNVFSSDLLVSLHQIPQLVNNRSFGLVRIRGGELAAGSVPNDRLILEVLGTTTTENIQYLLEGGFTVQEDTTLIIGANVRLTIPSSQTLIHSARLKSTHVVEKVVSQHTGPKLILFDVAFGGKDGINYIICCRVVGQSMRTSALTDSCAASVPNSRDGSSMCSVASTPRATTM